MYASVVHSTQGGIYKCDNVRMGTSSVWTKLSNPPRTEGHPYVIVPLYGGSILCTYSGRMTNDRKSFLQSSGVFLSTDKGATWIDKSDQNMLWWTKDIVVDRNDPTQNTWYAGVFSGWGGGANNRGGLYKTTNRGTSWTKILAKERVESCTIHPENKDEMYVSTEYEGLFITKNLSSSNPSFSLVQNYPFKHPMRIFYNPYVKEEVFITSFGYGVVKGTTAYVQLPEKVILRQPVNNYKNINSPVPFTWQYLGSGVTYNLQVSDKNDFSDKIVDRANIPQTNFTSPALFGGTTYYWRVCGTNAAGNGPWSDVWTFTTKSDQPNLPSDVVLVSPFDKFSISADSSVTLLWNSQPNIIKYFVEYADNASFTSSISDSGLVDTTYKITSLKAFENKNLYWHVRAQNSAGWGNYGVSRTISVTKSTGVTDFTEESLAIYPNPANDMLFIRTNEVIGKIRIYNNFGNKLIETLGSNSIDISNLNSGVYIISISTGIDILTRKIQIVR